MITENTIDGLIPCQERMIYGESLLYYDITSRQSIQSILEAQPLQMRHLQKLFSGLRTISEVMEKYLLSPEDLLLLPEFVYMDMATGEYSFIYYPERMGEKNRGTQWRGKKHYFRIFRLIFSNSLPPRVLWVRSLLLLPADAFFRYCPGVQPLC